MKRGLAVLAIMAILTVVSCVSSPVRPDPTPPVVEPGPSAAATTPAPNAAKDRAKTLVQGGAASTGTTPASPATPPAGSNPPPGTGAASDSVDVPPPAPGVMTADEVAFMERYLAGLNYLVYYDAESGASKTVAKTAVGTANKYLIEKLGLSVIDFDQIEKNKKDQQAAYQAETGGSIDIIQYLAQKLNADVYVELSFTVSEKADGGRFYASIQGSIKIYDTSTSQLLGSIPYQSAQAVSPVSQDAAVQNAVAGGIWSVMPKMTEQTKMLIKNSLSNGVRYELILQKTPDSKAISTLRRQLGKKFRLVEQVSYSASETKISLFTFQSKTYVEDSIYDAAERAGFPDLYLVFQRGKSFTFNTGL